MLQEPLLAAWTEVDRWISDEPQLAEPQLAEPGVEKAVTMNDHVLAEAMRVGDSELAAALSVATPRSEQEKAQEPGDASVEPTTHSVGHASTVEGHVIVALDALRDYAKGQRAARKSTQIHTRNRSVSRVAAVCCLVLTVPLWVWPVGDWLDFYFPGFSAFYISGLSTMILQILFTIYVDMGTTIQLAMQGVLGTFIAWANACFLYWTVLGRGTFVEGAQSPQSAWLPLCVSGGGVLRFVEHSTTQSCFLNVKWDDVQLSGLAKIGIVLTDLVAVVSVVLHLGFDNNTRAFSLSCTVWFLMAFLDPSVDSYGTGVFPRVPTNYLILVFFGSLVAVLCFSFPWLGSFDPANAELTRRLSKRPTIRALERATNLSWEASESVSAILSSSAETFTELVRSKAVAAREESETILEDLTDSLRVAWWETLPPWDIGEAGYRRRWLNGLCQCLKEATHDLHLLHHAAAQLQEEDAKHLMTWGSLPKGCWQAGDLILAAYKSYNPLYKDSLGSGVKELRKVAQAIEAEWTRKRAGWGDKASPHVAAFLFVFWGVIRDTANAVEKFSKSVESGNLHKPPQLSLWQSWRPDRDVTHPRFVLRNTVSISLLFLMGITGVGPILPAYTFMPAAIVSVIIYKYTGTSQKMALDRLTGVVLGKVLGTLAILALAVRRPGYAAMYALVMYKLVNFVFYIYIEGNAQSFVACLTVAYAGSAMVPSQPFRTSARVLGDGVQHALLQNIINAVLGVSVMTLVDLQMASRASYLLRGAKQVAIGKTAQYAGTVFEEAEGGLLEKRGEVGCEAGYGQRSVPLDSHDHDAAAAECRAALDRMADLFKPATEEPKYWRPPIKASLYRCLNQRLDTIQRHLATMVWCVNSTPETDSLSVDKAVATDAARFQHFFPRLSDHVAGRMGNLKVLAKWATRSPLEDFDDDFVQIAFDVREELMKMHFNDDISAVVKARVAGVRREASTSKSPAVRRGMPRAPTKFAKSVRGLFKMVFREGLQVELLTVQKMEVLKLEHILDELESTSGANRHDFGVADTLFRVGRVELLIGLVRSLLDEIKAIELELLGY
mmetsp:Transcript_71795/g.191487  ORF Transcript_71795/g.191487 Transcript_71795/m.191487 type:complete len:1064 (+) Transcript_71795:1848-5039(+)